MGLYKPRRIWTFYICLLNHFNPRGRKDLDLNRGNHHGGYFYFNPRGRKDLDGKLWV